MVGPQHEKTADYKLLTTDSEIGGSGQLKAKAEIIKAESRNWEMGTSPLPMGAARGIYAASPFVSPQAKRTAFAGLDAEAA